MINIEIKPIATNWANRFGTEKTIKIFGIMVMRKRLYLPDSKEWEYYTKI